jgi:hypothetical protein
LCRYSGEVPTRCAGANLRWEAAHNLVGLYKLNPVDP